MQPNMAREDFYVDPVVLLNRGIDIILGMDWMKEHNVLLDITSRIVRLSLARVGKLCTFICQVTGIRHPR
ncbi:hypothetical protein U9M48_037078 [Paspalum notatum var. saurae]|uniref:Uncharacterized protein n=1 Tax=Paspalum notatum var. saurae TaxID=547442 RepID=A0AAQ3UGB8_PASNO